jgi:hypothetical protein
LITPFVKGTKPFLTYSLFCPKESLEFLKGFLRKNSSTNFILPVPYINQFSFEEALKALETIGIPEDENECSYMMELLLSNAEQYPNDCTEAMYQSIQNVTGGFHLPIQDLTIGKYHCSTFEDFA